MISKISYYITAEPGKYLQDKSGRSLGIAAWLAIGISPDDYINVGTSEERLIYFPDEGKVLHNKETEEVTTSCWIKEEDLSKWEEIDKPIEPEEPESTEEEIKSEEAEEIESIEE